jgi:predicted TIM-barrel fold metal-dependent hydrolase
MHSQHYDDLPIVDAPHHLWDLEGDLTYPWMISGGHACQSDNSALRRAYLSGEYRRDTAARLASRS